MHSDGWGVGCFGRGRLRVLIIVDLYFAEWLVRLGVFFWRARAFVDGGSVVVRGGLRGAVGGAVGYGPYHPTVHVGPLPWYCHRTTATSTHHQPVQIVT